jgi:uncharacterized membrane protein
MNDCYISIKNILKLLNIRFSTGYLKEEVLSHPHFPSLLCISDVLDKYKISQASIKIGQDRLDEVPLPSIVQVSVRGKGFFHTLTHISEETVTRYDEHGKENEVPREDFLKVWTGVTLLVERNEDSAEPGMGDRIQQRRIRITLMGILVLFVLIGLGMGLNELVRNGSLLFAYSFILLKSAGLVISVLVLWREIDQDNPVVQKFCSGEGKTDCNAVLDTTDLKFADEAISPGSLAFAYFFAGFFLLLTNVFSLALFALIGWLSLATIPLVIISIYYQAFKIKKWCRLCLILVSILLLEMALSWIGQFHHPIEWTDFSEFAVLFLGVVLVWMYLKPILDKKNDFYNYKRNLKKFKSNPAIFESLLSQSKKINNPTEGLGILIKNKSPRYHVIKVSNPYCDPCAKAHPELERLVEDGSIDLQVLYFPNGDMEDPTTKTISHFLAIAAKEDQQETLKALDQWYNTAGGKDYAVFAGLYPMNGEVEQQGEKIRNMKDWCVRQGITHTPTLFINGYKLPKDYSIEELKEIITQRW